MSTAQLATIDISGVTSALGTAVGDVSTAALSMVETSLPLVIPVFAAFVVIGIALRIVGRLIGN